MFKFLIFIAAPEAINLLIIRLPILLFVNCETVYMLMIFLNHCISGVLRFCESRISLALASLDFVNSY